MSFGSSPPLVFSKFSEKGSGTDTCKCFKKHLQDGYRTQDVHLYIQLHTEFLFFKNLCKKYFWMNLHTVLHPLFYIPASQSRMTRWVTHVSGPHKIH